MDLYQIIDLLLDERNRIDRIIRSLESAMPQGRQALGTKRRGRKSMDDAARREVADRMKRYWAKRREGTAPAASEQKPVSGESG